MSNLLPFRPAYDWSAATDRSCSACGPFLHSLWTSPQLCAAMTTSTPAAACMHEARVHHTPHASRAVQRADTNRLCFLTVVCRTLSLLRAVHCYGSHSALLCSALHYSARHCLTPSWIVTCLVHECSSICTCSNLHRQCRFLTNG